MKIRSQVGMRHLSLATAAVMAIGIGVAGPARAASSYGWSHAASGKGGGAPFATAVVANDTLTITGTNGPDNISYALNGDPNLLDVNLSNGAFPDFQFDRSTFSAIAVFLQGGDDHFTVNGTSPDETLTVDGGSGNDTITTGSGNDLIFGGDGNDTINSGAGDDVIDAGRGDDSVVGGVGHDTAFLGSGDDSFVWNPGEGSDFVSGDSGDDTLVFKGAPASEQMSLSANGPLAVFLRQPGNVRMDLDGIQELDLTALGGADTITVNDTSGTDLTRANIDLGSGDGAKDSVTVNGTDNRDRVRVHADGGRVDVEGLQPETRITGSEPANDHLQVNTLGGRDKIRVDDGVSTLIGVDTDLGTI